MGSKLVRFLKDDPAGLWRAGDLAHDLGQESPGMPVWILRMAGTYQLISLSRPYERNLIEEVE